jgi:hypothetical protein
MKKIFFDKTKKGTDPLYGKICDSPQVYLDNINQRFEELWLEFKDYADRGFEQQFRDAVVSRFWEMYLGALLLKQNKKLIPKKLLRQEWKPIPKEKKKNEDYGPDFCINANDGEKIWIEATAADKVVEKKEEEIILKIRSRIKAKYNGGNGEIGKYKKYRADGLIEESEPYIIAINGSNLDSPESPYPIEPPKIIRAVFGVGVPYVYMGSNIFNFENRKKIETKKKGSPVGTDIFFDKEYAGISAIIYSEISPLFLRGCSNPYTDLKRDPYGPDYTDYADLDVLNFCTRYTDGFGCYFLIVYNPCAKNPLNRDWLENKGTQF